MTYVLGIDLGTNGVTANDEVTTLGRGGGDIQRIDLSAHRDRHAQIGATHDRFRKPGAFVAEEHDPCVATPH